MEAGERKDYRLLYRKKEDGNEEVYVPAPKSALKRSDRPAIDLEKEEVASAKGGHERDEVDKQKEGEVRADDPRPLLLRNPGSHVAIVSQRKRLHKVLARQKVVNHVVLDCEYHTKVVSYITVWK